MFIVIGLLGEPFVAINEDGDTLYFDTKEEAEIYGAELQDWMAVELP